MKNLLKLITALLLLFNGIGAIYGGGNLILFPDGSSIQLSLDWLNHTPFNNYLIPGIILFVSNGLFSILVVTAIIIDYKFYPELVIVQGVVLTGWIITQIILIQTIYSLHLIFLAVGLILIIFGWIFNQFDYA